MGHIDKDDGPRAEIFRCNITWNSDTEFMLGWANSVKIVSIKDRNVMDVASGLPPKYLHVVHSFRVDFVVCGLAPLEDSIVLLGYDVDLEEYANIDVLAMDAVASVKTPKISNPPEIHVLDLEGNEIANDVISLAGYQLFQANDYHLEFVPGKKPSDFTYYIVSPKDVIVAKPRDVKDHVEWLVELEQFADALDLVEKSQDEYADRQKDETILEIGQKYIQTLLKQGLTVLTRTL